MDFNVTFYSEYIDSIGNKRERDKLRNKAIKDDNNRLSNKNFFLVHRLAVRTVLFAGNGEDTELQLVERDDEAAGLLNIIEKMKFTDWNVNVILVDDSMGQKVFKNCNLIEETKYEKFNPEMTIEEEDETFGNLSFIFNVFVGLKKTQEK